MCSTVQYRLMCSSEDPHVSARVLGLLAARSIVPLIFKSALLPPNRVTIEIVLEDREEIPAPHLARLFARLQAVIDVVLEVDGRAVEFSNQGDAWPRAV